MIPLQARSTVQLRGVDDQPVAATVEEVAQRAWSRTARARGDRSEPWFLKQFRGRDGRWHGENFHDEALGARLAAERLPSFVAAPIVGRSDEQLVLAYPYRDLTTPDELLREDPHELQAIWPVLCERLRTLVHELTEAPETGSDLVATKRRTYPSRTDALLFKGLDVRNLGWSGPETRLWVFDVGRPYIGPVEEAAAKLFVSVGLLNWGRPVSRYCTGPPIALLEPARSALDEWLIPEAVRREVKTQFAGRRRHPAGRSFAGRAVRRGLIESMGRMYVRRLLAWCESHAL